MTSTSGLNFVYWNNNPSGRVWLKLDGTDVKESLQHSVKGEWNGDVNLNNGHLEGLREDFDNKLAWIELIQSSIEFQNILEIGISCLEADTEFLRNSFTNATNELQKKITIKTTNSETLKGLNWDVVECNTLLQQSLEFSSKLKSVVNPRLCEVCKSWVCHIFEKPIQEKEDCSHSYTGHSYSRWTKEQEAIRSTSLEFTIQVPQR